MTKDALKTPAPIPPPLAPPPLKLSPEAAALKPVTVTMSPSGASTTITPEITPKIAQEIAQEIGGPKGPEPTRFGDWERKGRCSDF